MENEPRHVKVIFPELLLRRKSDSKSYTREILHCLSLDNCLKVQCVEQRFGSFADICHNVIFKEYHERECCYTEHQHSRDSVVGS